MALFHADSEDVIFRKTVTKTMPKLALPVSARNVGRRPQSLTTRKPAPSTQSIGCGDAGAFNQV